MSGNKESGSTLVELVIGIFILGMIATSFFGLYNALITSSVTAKQKSAASILVTNQMEYLKSLPYNNLAVVGGSILAQNPLPASFTKKVDNYTFTVKTSVSYIDDAFDGCTSYPTPELKQKYCRNYPAPNGAPAIDQNPQDYKIINVAAFNRANVQLASVDTQISARVAETASNTGSLFVNIIDSTGNPVQGATVSVSDPTLNPQVAVSDSTDSGGIAIFYGLPPDTSGFDYKISASLNGYSTIFSIVPSGSLQPNFPSQNIFAQQSSYVTLTINPQNTHSLIAETVNTSGAPLANVKLYLKGGYKKYNATSDTSYYFDTMNPTDTRPVTDGSGLATILDLAPGDYHFCGDAGATSCAIGGTTYYLAAAVPYGGSSALSPINVPANLATNSTFFDFNGTNYLQKVKLILTTNASFPRALTLSPSEVSKTGGTIGAFSFKVTGANLPCSAVASSCTTSVKLIQSSQTFTASCVGSGAGLQLDCTVDLSAADISRAALQITANGNTLNMPASPLPGGVNVAP